MKKNANFYSIAKIAAKKTIETGGCTINMTGNQPHTGYMVGTFGNEIRIDLKNFDQSGAQIDAYIRAHLSHLFGDNKYLGLWVENDTVYIDISVRYENKIQAIKAGIINKQHCVYDLVKQTEIYNLIDDPIYCELNYN